MTKNEKYEHTLQAILDLKHSKMLHFDVFRNLKVTGHESIKGIIGMLSKNERSFDRWLSRILLA